MNEKTDDSGALQADQPAGTRGALRHSCNSGSVARSHPTCARLRSSGHRDCFRLMVGTRRSSERHKRSFQGGPQSLIRPTVAQSRPRSWSGAMRPTGWEAAGLQNWAEDLRASSLPIRAFRTLDRQQASTCL